MFRVGGAANRAHAEHLEELNGNHLNDVAEIVGSDLGAELDTETGRSLRRQGYLWAQHVLEGPLSWIISALYILITVLCHQTPLGLLLLELPYQDGRPPEALSHATAVADAFIYAFLPWWTTVLIRLFERRTLLHRVAGRTIVIGDHPPRPPPPTPPPPPPPRSRKE